ncbi:hypothetical protein WEI85_12395 [Actinomycetes bacterium KLBMP 9797]
MGGLVRGYIRHRTRLQVERERSARARARAAERVRLAGNRRQLVRIDERDSDGHRIVEIGIRRTGVAKGVVKGVVKGVAKKAGEA